MNKTTNIKLQSANRRNAGNGHMVICDALVDQQPANVIFWDPDEATERGLVPGAEVNVTEDGEMAKWRTHQGKTSFQVKKGATLSFGTTTTAQPNPSPGFPAAAPAAAPAAPATSKQQYTAEDILSRAAELVVFYAAKLAAKGVPQEVINHAAPQAPTIISSWWFGAGKWA